MVQFSENPSITSHFLQFVFSFHVEFITWLMTIFAQFAHVSPLASLDLRPSFPVQSVLHQHEILHEALDDLSHWKSGLLTPWLIPLESSAVALPSDEDVLVAVAVAPHFRGHCDAVSGLRCWNARH